MEDNSNSKRLVILFSICLVLLPSLLVSSLWMAKKRRPNHSNEVTNDVATKPDEYYYRDPRPQVVYLDHIVKKFRQDSKDKSSRYGSSYTNLQVIDDTSVANNDYTSDADYHNDVDPHHYGEKPNCNEDKKKKKKVWNNLSKKKKASIILGSIGFAFGKLGLISFSSLVVTEETTTTSTTSTTTPTTTTSTTSTTSTTTPTTTISTTSTTTTTTTTTTMMPMTCSTTMNTATGSYKTIRTPGTQVEQCLSVTVALGSNIRITCTSINVSTGTYVTFLDLLGTNILANPPILNTAYTTADNTLIIKSLASSANADQLCCDWVTV
ncbi:cell wall integrity and stress response component 3 [Daphnia magna]|uniref:cell wall integrity and stress response component 3 n=1 Tax=Daphnia magna TaxID=35525 RepID=UPI001E1BDB70|nr:cell wall integrity and stress response component 3 [Daphnia magna]